MPRKTQGGDRNGSDQEVNMLPALAACNSLRLSLHDIEWEGLSAKLELHLPPSPVLTTGPVPSCSQLSLFLYSLYKVLQRRSAPVSHSQPLRILNLLSFTHAVCVNEHLLTSVVPRVQFRLCLCVLYTHAYAIPCTTRYSVNIYVCGQVSLSITLS